MTKYAEWDRYRERFATISLNPRGLCAFLESVDDKKVETIARVRIRLIQGIHIICI